MSHANLTQLISERIGLSAADIKERVITLLVEKELVERTNKIVNAMTEVDKFKKLLNKSKPDIKTYNEDGSTATETWSKDKIDERKLCQDKLNKLEVALIKAIESGSYDELNNIKFS